MTASLFSLAGRVAVVVGGSSGIGRTLALGLADAGADVVATARREDRVHEMADAEWQGILDTNLTGTWNTCRVFGAPMVDRGSGRIITIASLASFVGFFEVSAYTATKAAIAGLTRALAVEWAPRGVLVNAIVPGIFRTDLNRDLIESARGQELITRTPMRRFGEVDELVGAAVFLASDAASFVTGHLLVVDGGFLASGVNV